jgi:hypothetical protein
MPIPSTEEFGVLSPCKETVPGRLSKVQVIDYYIRVPEYLPTHFEGSPLTA